jgi:hypothetical protein
MSCGGLLSVQEVAQKERFVGDTITRRLKFSDVTADVVPSYVGVRFRIINGGFRVVNV